MVAVVPNALSGINNADVEKSKHCPGFANVEDMIVAASENAAICGAHQKAHMFKISSKFI